MICWLELEQWDTALYCSRTLNCSAVQFSKVQCGTTQFSTVQCSAIQCSAVQCSAVQCSTVLYSAVAVEHTKTIGGSLISPGELSHHRIRERYTPTNRHIPALYCTVLHCSALDFTILHCTALKCNKLPCTAVFYSALRCIKRHCTALHSDHCTATSLRYKPTV